MSARRFALQGHEQPPPLHPKNAQKHKAAKRTSRGFEGLRHPAGNEGGYPSSWVLYAHQLIR
jgi:hypothetical protein